MPFRRPTAGRLSLENLEQTHAICGLPAQNAFDSFFARHACSAFASCGDNPAPSRTGIVNRSNTSQSILRELAGEAMRFAMTATMSELRKSKLIALTSNVALPMQPD